MKENAVSGEERKRSFIGITWVASNFETTGVDGKKNVGFLGSRVVRELTAEISSL